MVALMISAIVVVLVAWLVGAVNQFNHRDLGMPTDWYLFVVELESSDRHFKLIKCQDTHHVILHGLTTGKDYELVADNPRIYLRLRHGGGYLPMLYQVQKAEFRQLDNQRLLMEVQRNNGQKQAAIVNLSSAGR